MSSTSSTSSVSENSFDGFELVDSPFMDTRKRLDAVADRVQIDSLKRQLEGVWLIHHHTDGDDFLRSAGDDDFSRALFYTAKRSIHFAADNCMELSSLVNTTQYKLLRIPLGGPFNLEHLGVSSYFTENSVKVVWGFDEEAGMNSEEFVLTNKNLVVINRRFEHSCTRTYIKLEHLDTHLSQLEWYQADNTQLDAQRHRLELENSELFLQKTMLKWQLNEMERQLSEFKLEQPNSQKAIDEMLCKVHPNLVLDRDTKMMPEVYAFVLGSWEMISEAGAVPVEYHTITYAFNTASCKLWRKLNGRRFEEIEEKIVVLNDSSMMIVERDDDKYMCVGKNGISEHLYVTSYDEGRARFDAVYKRV